MTYEGLDRKANQLAHYLADKGVNEHHVVGILMGRCAEQITAQLAAWKAGAAFVPIDPGYPVERIRYLVEDSGAAALLTQSGLKERLPEQVFAARCPVIYMDEAKDEIAREPTAAPGRAVDPGALAYVIYTSGSTGRPKGSCITHRNLLNLVRWHAAAFDINERDRASQLAGVAFDAMVWEVWPYLSAGACVVPLAEGLDTLLPADLAAWLAHYQITRSFIPTKLAEMLLAMDLSGLFLQTVFTGGDRLSFVPAKHGFRLINNYGPTETTVVAASVDVSEWENEKGNPPIGKPIANTSLYVLDRFLAPVPIGVVGEIYVGGAGVGKGYLNDPDKTRNAFVPNPFTGGRDGYFTGQAIGSGGCRTGTWILSGGRTSRWRSGGTASNPGR